MAGHETVDNIDQLLTAITERRRTKELTMVETIELQLETDALLDRRLTLAHAPVDPDGCGAE